VLIECGPRDDRSLAASEPRVVIEVLSPSTTRYDRVEKLAEYQAHEAIRVILLVNTEAPVVSVWRRLEDGRWNTEIAESLGAVIPLPEIEAELPLAELYLDLSFDQA
jgi:Uma2 family endonuclease